MCDGAKPLPESVLTQIFVAIWRHYAILIETQQNIYVPHIIYRFVNVHNITELCEHDSPIYTIFLTKILYFLMYIWQ